MKKAVITGMGVISPLGNDIDTFWSAIKAGKSGLGPITRFDASAFDSKIAAEVKDFDPSQFMEKRDARKMALFTQLAVAAAVQACLPEGPAVVRGNGAGVRRILENRLQIAVEAGGQEILLEVGLAARAGSFLLWVEDGGPGIPQERRQEIFEPFRSGREGGTGLGLAIVRGLVEAQGGRVQAADAQRLGGVRFEILLPAMEGP